MRTIDKIITNCDCKYGAPMGRDNVGITYAQDPELVESNIKQKIFDCGVPLNSGYDKGGAYWGLPNNLRVSYTKDLQYIHFYRT